MSLKLNLNEPIQLTLTRIDAKVYPHGDKPASHMYSVKLDSGQTEKLFATPALSETLQQMRIQANEIFTLVRRKTPQNMEYFEVHSANVSTDTRRPLNPPAAVPAKAPARATTSQQTMMASTPRNLASTIMANALKAAIDAAGEAVSHAQQKGVKIEFQAADIRAMADTMFIEACRNPLLKERQGEAA